MESPEEYSTAQISVSGNDAVALSDEIYLSWRFPWLQTHVRLCVGVIQRCVTGQGSSQLLQTDNVKHIDRAGFDSDI